MIKVPKTVFASGRGLKAGDVLKGKRILASPVVHLGMVHYFVLNKQKDIEHKKIPADTEVMIRRPRYNHVVFIAPKVVVQQNHPGHDASEPAGPPYPVSPKLLEQLSKLF